MAMYPASAPETNSVRPGIDDDVIELRPLLDTLLRWWREILLITIVAVALGIAIVMLQRTWGPTVYEASAQVAVARIVSNVNLDENYQTRMTDINTTQDRTARRASLLGLAESSSIAISVIEELDPLFNGVTPATLVAQISASFTGDNNSDLIAIRAVADTPEKAAALANAWARHYVEQINALYGEIPTDVTEVVEVELEKAIVNRDTAQQEYEQFLAQNEMQTLSRQINEREQLIRILQGSRQASVTRVMTQSLAFRQEAITTYMDAVQQNRLLAFTEEQTANREFVREMIASISENRLLAFSTEQQARIDLFTQYANLELQNRLLAIQQEQNAKTQIFQAYSGADLTSKLTVFNEQANDRVQSLIESYSSKRSLEQILDKAIALQNQIDQAGEAGARSNSLPILLLKIEAFAAAATSADEMPSNLQIDLTDATGLDLDIDNQAQDLAALINIITAQIAQLDERIAEQSVSMFNNEGFQLLDGVRPEDDTLYEAIQKQYLDLFEVGELAQAENTVAENSALSQAIIAKYEELFGLGALTSASLVISDTTPIYVALAEQYPSLFAVGDIAFLGDALADGSALAGASEEKIREMLQPLEELESYLMATEASDQAVLKLENELKGLQATLENQRAQQEILVQRRNLAMEAYNTFNSKLLELTLLRTAANREVRLASPASTPDSPMRSLSLLVAGVGLGVVGFLLAILIALLANYLNIDPFLSRQRVVQVGPAAQVHR